MKASDASRALALLTHKVRELETEVGKLKKRIAAAGKARKKVAAAARAAAIDEAARLADDRCVPLEDVAAIRALATKPGSDT